VAGAIATLQTALFAMSMKQVAALTFSFLVVCNNKLIGCAIHYHVVKESFRHRE
jgi:hypothetical protein